MRIRLPHVALVICILAVAAQSLVAQPPYRRRDLNTLSPGPAGDLMELRQLIMNFLTAPVIALHLTPGIHSADEHFLAWHRGYIEMLESWLMTQPNGTKYVPLPKYNPLNVIPNEFYNALGGSGSAVVTGYPPLTNQNPMFNLSWYVTPPNPCNWTADGFGNVIDGPHGSVHVAIGGSMGALSTASATAIFWSWHSFLDDMYRYYQCICQNATGIDLYMKDDVKDIGTEPNTTAPHNVYNGSPDIWVRNAQDTYNPGPGKYSTEDDPTHFQNPVYIPGGFNYVYVRIRNRGCNIVPAGTCNLHAYWSYYSTGAAMWPIDWTDILPAGIPVPALAPGQQYVAEFRWAVPNPQEHPNAPTKFCLLARNVSNADPMAVVEGTDVLTNVKNNNNIAWRNVDVVPADPYLCNNTAPCEPLYVKQVYGNPTYDKIRFDYEYDNTYGYNPVYMEVDLGHDLYTAWQNGGYDSYGIVRGQGDGNYKVTVTQPGAYIGNIHLTPGQTYEPCAHTYIKNPPYGGYGGYGGHDGYGGDAGYGGYGGYGGGQGTYGYGGYGNYGGVYPVHITQYETYGGVADEQPVGGATYEVRAVRDEAALPYGNNILNEVITHPPCPEANDVTGYGSIQLTVPNEGTNQYNYYWSNGASTRDVYNLQPGTYNVVVRDDVNCTIDTRTYSVTPTSGLGIDMSGGLSHCGDNSGYVQCGVTGGVPPYTYAWTYNGAPQPQYLAPIIPTATQGVYTVGVTDANGCVIHGTMNVYDKWDMVTVAVNTTPATGPNKPDGRASAVAHGMPPLVYHWSTGQASPQIAGLLPGDYWVDVTDMGGNGCTKRANYHIAYTGNESQSVITGNSVVDNTVMAPNPTSGATELRYHLQRPGLVQIELYDNVGRRVDVLYGGYLTVGDQLLPINTEGIASGQYTVRILTSDVTTTVPLTVVH